MSFTREMPIDVQYMKLELKSALSLDRRGFHWLIMVCSGIAFHNHKFFFKYEKYLYVLSLEMMLYGWYCKL